MHIREKGSFNCQNHGKESHIGNALKRTQRTYVACFPSLCEAFHGNGANYTILRVRIRLVATLQFFSTANLFLEHLASLSFLLEKHNNKLAQGVYNSKSYDTSNFYSSIVVLTILTHIKGNFMYNCI